MNYSAIKNHDIANGPGVRVSIFVSGCNIRCDGCFNRMAWDFKAGKQFTEDTIKEIIEMLKPDYIDGLTILGGEPFDVRNRSEVTYLMNRVRMFYGDTKSIWVFSGYVFEDCCFRYSRRSGKAAFLFLSYIDVLVDGPFIKERKNLSLKFRGSENQRIIDVNKSMEQGKVVLWADEADVMKERSLMHLDKIIEEEKNAAGH